MELLFKRGGFLMGVLGAFFLVIFLGLMPHAVFASSGFITTWDTTKSGIDSDHQITIPTFSGDIYNYDVDWGDGPSDTNITGDAQHTYGSSGIYTVTITGQFPRIYFNDGGDDQKIISIEQWGSNVWDSMGSAFSGCSNLVSNATDVPDLDGLTDMSAMLQGASLFNSDIGNWNVSHVTNMSGMFMNAASFNQDISGWNVSHVTDMSFMFGYSCPFNQNISAWDVSSVTTMRFMFFNDQFNNGGQALAWGSKTSHVSDMSGMFAYQGFDQDISSWDVTGATNMIGMFAGDTISVDHYESLLLAWSAELVKPNLTFNAGNNQYRTPQAKSARAVLTNSPNNWSIADGGVSLPNLKNASVTATMLTLAYDYPLASGSVPAASSYSVTINGSTNDPVSTVSVPAGSKVILTLANPVHDSDTVTVSYTVPGTNAIQDAYGNQSVALSNQSVTIISNTVTVSSSVYTVSALVNGAGTISNIPSTAVDSDLISNIVLDQPDETLVINHLNVSPTLQSGDTLVVTAQDGITTATYTLAVNAPPSGDSSLSATSTIKGMIISNLGTPRRTFGPFASPGSVTINAVQAADSSNSIPFVTNIIPTNSKASIVKVSKFAAGTLVTPSVLAGAVPYANQSITDGDFFIIKIVSEAGTYSFYKIVVTVVSVTDINSAGVTNLVVPVTANATESFGGLIPNDGTYTVTDLTWSPSDNPYLPSTSYVATITLTSAPGSKFPVSGILAPTTDTTGVVSAGTTNGGDVSGNTLSFNVTFAETGALPSYVLGYVAGAHGTIVGNSPQTVTSGSNGSPVTAVADAGYVFVDWSDGSVENPRTDVTVTKDISVTANFAPSPVSPAGNGTSGTMTGGSRALHYCNDTQALNYGSYSDCSYKSSGASSILGTGTCPANLVITENLKQGAHDGIYNLYTQEKVTQVSILQAHINRILAASYKQAAGPTDGVFGKLTKQGVQRLQMALNTILKPSSPLKLDGIVGAYTRAAINDSCGVGK